MIQLLEESKDPTVLSEMEEDISSLYNIKWTVKIANVEEKRPANKQNEVIEE